MAKNYFLFFIFIRKIYYLYISYYHGHNEYKCIVKRKKIKHELHNLGKGTIQ